jgi:SAM-dependent methyltransferase
MGTERYVIQGGIAGRERLRLLSEVMGQSTRDLLAIVGISPGAVCLDIGCGGGDVSCDLARAVGSTGRVIGIDLDQAKLAIARQEAAQENLANIVFETQDVTTWQPNEQFDIVYARFLLTHLPNPGDLISAMSRCMRPGGVIIVEDIDYRGHFAEPACPALDRSVELYTKSVQRRGADPNIGPRLPGLLREAGIEDVQMRLVHPAALQGGIKLLICVTLESIAEAALADGFATEVELRETIQALYEFAQDPHTVMGGPRVFQAWGRSKT